MANQDSNALRAAEFASDSAHEQSQSALFSVLPGEIRNHIWNYALADYEDTTQLYDDATCYKRPDYFAPRKTDTVLLRTCKRIYQEAWFLPWTNAEQTFYLTSTDRRPPRTTTPRDMQRTLLAISRSQTMPIIQHVRVFPQLYALENGQRLQEILNLRFFYPKVITITIRHTDWWFWESDNNLHFDATWVDFCRFPNSLTELRVAFESLERKKDQIDDVVRQAIEGWVFRRKDDTELSAKHCEPEIMRWNGSATWHHHRWIRDETGPNKLDYYVCTVTWRPVGSTNKEEAPGAHMTGSRRFPNLDAIGYTQLNDPTPSVPISFIRNADLPLDAPTEDIRRLLVQPSSEEEENEDGLLVPLSSEEEEDEDEDEEDDGSEEDEDEFEQDNTDSEDDEFMDAESGEG